MNETKRKTLLILTVGGSPKPLAHAIKETKPDAICFIVSQDDGSTKSSLPIVEDEKIDYDRSLPKNDENRYSPGLKHLLECPKKPGILEVPPDDPGKILALIDSYIAKKIKDYSITADYTGGTKSMTAGLVMAATAREGVRLQFMLGDRPDLRKVTDGTEKPTEISSELFGLSKIFTTVNKLSAKYSYGAAYTLMCEAKNNVAGLKGVKPPKSWNKRIANWKHWFQCLDMWDRFEHEQAYEFYKKQKNNDWAKLFAQKKLDKRLEILAKNNGKASRPLVEDLWLNAHRRAEQGQYDDAIARLYRLTEACFQAELLEKNNIDTSYVHIDKIPHGIQPELKTKEKQNPKTKEKYYQLGLEDSRKLLAHLYPNHPLVTSWPEQPPKWRGQRNNSVLAHGFKPLGEKDWEEAQQWFVDKKWFEKTDKGWRFLDSDNFFNQLPNTSADKL